MGTTYNVSSSRSTLDLGGWTVREDVWAHFHTRHPIKANSSSPRITAIDKSIHLRSLKWTECPSRRSKIVWSKIVLLTLWSTGVETTPLAVESASADEKQNKPKIPHILDPGRHKEGGEFWLIVLLIILIDWLFYIKRKNIKRHNNRKGKWHSFTFGLLTLYFELLVELLRWLSATTVICKLTDIPRR